MEMITEVEAGLRRGTRPRNQTSRDKISICRLHRYMTMRSGLAWGGLMAKETLKSTMSPPIASPDALNKAKSAVETESAREGYSPLTHNDDIIQSRKTEGGRGNACAWIEFWDHGGPAAHEMPGVGVFDPFDAVSTYY